MMESVLFVLSFLTFVILIECQDNVVHFNIPKSNFGLKLENSLIETKYDVYILASCARECFYVTKCKSFNYNKVDGICLLNSLNSTEADVADFVEDGKNIHSDLTDWNKEMVYTCGEKPCSLNEKCVPYKPHKCMAYCGNPNSVINAEVNRGEVLVGSVRNYKCIARHVPTSSDTSITCQSNSEWTAAYFQCIAYCGPPPILTNGDVGPGGETLHQTRTYTCREPYTASTSEISITCQQSTYWSSHASSCQLITTCQKVRNCNPSYGDGEYWLVLDNFDTTKRVKIHCNDMTGTPYETLMLDNSWKTWFINPLGQHHNGYYNNIAIDVKTLRLSAAQTESGTNHCMIGYGTVSSHTTCHMTSYHMYFYLENTGFLLNPIPTWSFTEGNTQSISVESLPNKQLEVYGYISWSYGYVTYSAPFTLEIDYKEVLPEESAIKPQCP